jgi:hypothetical protein
LANSTAVKQIAIARDILPMAVEPAARNLSREA